MNIGQVSISFPRLGVVRFCLTSAPWDYLDLDRQRAASMLRWIRNGGGVRQGATKVFRA